MLMKITRGRVASAVRAVVYGTEGIGKTTLSSRCPNALILDTEGGSNQIDCARHRVDDWKGLTLAMAELAVEAQGFQTIVIDSADWAVRRLGDYVCTQHNKKSLEDFAYGKGYVHVADGVSQFLRSCDALVQNGMNVVFVAHSKVVRTSPPDQTDGFDRFELNLHKLVAPLFKEWCDLLLFCSYRTKLIEGGDGKTKATGGKQRLMHAERSAAWDAKNRYGLPEEMPMNFESIASIFPVATVDATVDVMKLMGNASKVIASAVTSDDFKAAGKRIDFLLKDGTLTPAQGDALTSQLMARVDAINAKEPASV